MMIEIPSLNSPQMYRINDHTVSKDCMRLSD